MGAWVVFLLALVPAAAHAKTVHYDNFLSPDRSVWCLGRYCATLYPSRHAFVSPSGKVSICNPTLPSEGCPQNWDVHAPILHYGDTSIARGARCVSARSGITCTVLAPDGRRKGFVAGARRLDAVGTVPTVGGAQTPLGFPENVPEEDRTPPIKSNPKYFGDHRCVVATGGRVRCWGADVFGQVGDGNAGTALKDFSRIGNPYVAAPTEVIGLDGATDVSVGGFHSCALLTGGHVACWGYGADGELGNGGRSDSATPVAVAGVADAVAISAGGEHTCALLADTTVACWGENADGELGDGTTANRARPVAVRGLRGVTAISAGAYQTCALLAGGAVSCWGRGFDGELGSGSKRSSAVPVAVQGVSGATAVSAAGRHACALLAGGTIACWGDGTYGELGNGSRDPAPTPVAVSGVTGATQISAGAYHTCALLSTGIECWGRGVSGQLGTGTDLGELTPAPVSGAAGATAISAGVQTTCATLPGGALSCWGNSQLSPAAVRGLPAAPPAGAQLPPPVFGRSADAQPVSGTVLVRPPGAPAFTPLSAATSLPVGTQIDTTSGRVQLTTAKGTGGRIQSGQFYGGIFTVGQVRTRVAGRRVGLTVLTLSGPLAACGGGRAAAVDKRKPRKRLVWGSAKGDFSTKGKYGSATVRGTRWLVQDSCAGTRVTVASGVVTVSDFARHRTITVRAPHSVLVRRRG